MKTGFSSRLCHGPRLAFAKVNLRIQLTFADSSDPLQELLGGRITLTEVIEGREEFLDAFLTRLQDITEPRQLIDLDFDADSTLPLRVESVSFQDRQ